VLRQLGPPSSDAHSLVLALDKHLAKPLRHIPAERLAELLEAARVDDAPVVVAEALQRAARLDHLALLELVGFEGVVGAGAKDEEEQRDAERPEICCGAGRGGVQRAEKGWIEELPGTGAHGWWRGDVVCDGGEDGGREVGVDEVELRCRRGHEDVGGLDVGVYAVPVLHPHQAVDE